MGAHVCIPLLRFQRTLVDFQVQSLLEGIYVISPSVGKWGVLVCGDVQGGVFWGGHLNFLDPGDISRQIVCVLPGCRRKNIASPQSGSVVS